MKRKIEVVASFIKKGRKFLIVKKEERWEFPGGKVKEGEKLKEALRREIREELGVEIEVGKLLFKFENENYLFYFFKSRIKEGKISLKEHKGLEWVEIGEIKNFKFYEPDEKFLSAMASFKQM